MVSTLVYLNGERRASAPLNASECLSEEYVRKPALRQGPHSIHTLLGGLLMAPCEANHNPSLLVRVHLNGEKRADARLNTLTRLREEYVRRPALRQARSVSTRA
jgi:hypothetical protein